MSESINKDILYKKINALTQQKDQIDKELRQIQNELNKISIFENEQYVGKCFKEVSEDDFDFKTIYYYKLLANDKDNPYCFWTLILEDHIEDKNSPTLYIHKKLINFLGANKYFLRQLTPISEAEFTKAFTDICNDIQKPIKSKETEDEDIVLKCPQCNSTGPLSQGASITTTVYYPPVWDNGVNINPDGNTTTTEFII